MTIKTITYTKDIQLSPHFALHEFLCKSGSKTVKYSEETIALLEKIFETCGNVGKAIITSGYRTPDYSVKVGGSRTDGHTVGIAVDLKWYDKNNNLIAPKYIACVAQDIGFTGVGLMANSIHLDTRTTANYKNGKWWGDETNGKNDITDFYSYCGITRSEVDKVLGRNVPKIEQEAPEKEVEAEPEKVEVIEKETEIIEPEITEKKEETTMVKEKKEQNRFKSWALWVSVAGAIWLILSAFGIPERIGITNDIWNKVINGIGGILVSFGIINNPTDKGAF